MLSSVLFFSTLCSLYSSIFFSLFFFLLLFVFLAWLARLVVIFKRMGRRKAAAAVHKQQLKVKSASSEFLFDFFYCINFYSCNSQNELFSSGDRGWFIFRSRPVERMGFSSALFALKFQPSVQQRPVQRDVFSEYIGLTHAQHPRVTPRTTREREELTKSESTKFFLCNDLTLDKDVKQGRNSSRGVDSNRSILLFNPLLSVALGRFLLFSIHLEAVFLEVHTFSDA